MIRLKVALLSAVVVLLIRRAQPAPQSNLTFDMADGGLIPLLNLNPFINCIAGGQGRKFGIRSLGSGYSKRDVNEGL